MTAGAQFFIYQSLLPLAPPYKGGEKKSAMRHAPDLDGDDTATKTKYIYGPLTLPSPRGRGNEEAV